MQALFRMQLATAPVGHEGAVTGLTWTIGGLGAILPGQAVTYLLPYSPFARTCTAVFFAVTIAVIDVVNVRILTLRHPSAQRTGTSPPDEGTALIESLPLD
jgi:nitrate/nitrite transporter NarK